MFSSSPATEILWDLIDGSVNEPKIKSSRKINHECKIQSFETNKWSVTFFPDQSLDRKAALFTGGRLTELETVSVSMLQVYLVCLLLESELISENKGEQVNFLRALVMSLVL